VPKKGKAVFKLAMALLALAAMPSAEEFEAEVSDNISTEYVECAAYYALTQMGIEKSGADGGPAKKAYEVALERALLTAKTGRTDEMAVKVVTARFQVFSKAMMREIESNFSNMSLLMVKHADSCLTAMNDTDGLVKKWSDKVFEKYKK
jgi:hypothetical protein